MQTLELYPVTLPLRHTFTISRESRDEQGSLIVALSSGNDKGLGESTENPYYDVTIQGMIDRLDDMREIIEQTPIKSPEAYWDIMYEQLSDLPFALCALDQAANDLWAQRLQQPLYKAWGWTAGQLPLSNYTIGIADIDTMITKLQEMPWPLYKIKLGTNDDLAVIETLRQHTDATFRVDANCGWTAEDTLRIAPDLQRLGVEFIEQPLPAEDWEGMKKLYAESPLPIIADESCRVESDVARCAGHFHGINIKLTKCGGLTPARRMISEAQSLDLKTMVGCMTESSVGISALCQLAPQLDYIDADGALLLADEPAGGVQIEQGHIHLPDRPGTGAFLKTNMPT